MNNIGEILVKLNKTSEQKQKIIVLNNATDWHGERDTN